MDNQQEKTNLLDAAIWLRLLFMLLFVVLVQLAAAVMWVVVVLQFLFNLFSGASNQQLSKLGAGLSLYIYQSWQFLNFNSDEKPYPFQDWPSAPDQ